MEIKHFNDIAMGATFTVDGEKYTKRSELIYTDYTGMERYIEPLFDAKIGREKAGQAAPAPEVDTSAKIEKQEE